MSFGFMQLNFVQEVFLMLIIFVKRVCHEGAGLANDEFSDP